MSRLKIKNKWLRRSVQLTAIGFLLMNIIAFFHAYKFTHFSENQINKTKSPHALSWGEKIKTMLLGIDNPRPKNEMVPTVPYETIQLKGNQSIEAWYLKTNHSKGTVLVFHGYSGNKSSMLDKAEVFLNLGYSVFLADFRGSGGSEGNTTSIGYHEVDDVLTCYNYIKNQQEQRIFLFGTSMGAVAIMKALNDNKIQATGIMLECPFGSMYQTVKARFDIMNVPSFPMAPLMVFWGGVQNGFWAFNHNPIDYAQNISCPTLLMYGAKDKKVSRTEINSIFKNLKNKKQLKIYEKAGHENYMNQYQSEWTQDVNTFLNTSK
jgi:alpha-beta hydrolase superfamily lysophospholipase